MPDSATKGRVSTRAAVLAFLLPVVLLVPFAGKAYHLDDPFYLWVGQQILQNPFDFYGFTLNWSGTEAPAWLVNKNPPLVSYYAALIGLLFGWGEVAMHLAFLLPAGITGLGVYYLAARFCSRPLLATFATVLTPAFLVSASNIMAEVMMLCFYVWAIELWLRGLERDRPSLLWSAAVLIVLSTLSKYLGVSVIPLLVAYTLAEKRALGVWLLPLASAVCAILAYEMLTYMLYGQALLFEAGSYATSFRGQETTPRSEKLLTGLAFTGGCIAVAAFYAPWLWPRRVLVGAVILFAILLLLFVGVETLLPEDSRAPDGTIRWSFALHFTTFAVAGVLVLALAATDLWERRDSHALLLFLWVTGIFVFAAQVNWTTNARSILPMAVPIGILIFRRLETRPGNIANTSWRLWVPLLPALALSVTLLYADFRLANSARAAAAHFRDQSTGHLGTDWYTGHWGFQYYMELGDMKHVDVIGTDVQPGDVVIVPTNNMRKITIPEIIASGYRVEFSVFPWATTWNYQRRAGFYSDTWGHLPYAFGPVPAEQYSALTISKPATLRWDELDAIEGLDSP